MHRIQKEDGAYSKGIEVHDTLDSAVLSFWGRMKLAYGMIPSITFVSCKITDDSGNNIIPYDATWRAESETDEKFFLHYIRTDGGVINKNIDIMENYDTACGNLAAQMEYGYNNPRHPNVSFVSCEITGMDGFIRTSETWNKPVDTPSEAS